MSHGMSNIPTFRRGRTYHIGDKNGSACKGYCGIFLFFLVTIGVHYFIISSLRNYFLVFSSFYEIKDSIQQVDVSSSEFSRNLYNKPVYFSSDVIHSSIYEPDFHFEANQAVNLVRHTEYCQWTEISHDTCQTCQRSVRQENGKMKTESYSCNCVRTYNYLKAWRNYRINSLFFDQPAAHFNPQRDPFPSKTMFSQNTMVGDYLVIHDDFISKIKGKSHSIVWNKDQAAKDLRGIYDSRAFQQHHFTYAGNGYFFSPYETSTQEWIAKKFFQWLEGSILDYQFGDLLPSCVAGDIRVWYTAILPHQLSGIGQLSKTADLSVSLIGLYTSPSGTTIGLLREGLLSAKQLMDAELWDYKKILYGSRVLVVVWSVFISLLVKAFFGCLDDVGWIPFSLNTLSIVGLVNFSYQFAVLMLWNSSVISISVRQQVYWSPWLRYECILAIVGEIISILLFALTSSQFRSHGNPAFGGFGASKRMLLRWCCGPVDWYEAPIKKAYKIPDE